MNGNRRCSTYILYNGVLVSHKENKTMPFAVTWMQLEIILSEINQK